MAKDGSDDIQCEEATKCFDTKYESCKEACKRVQNGNHDLTVYKSFHLNYNVWFH